jgi:hypothetical protein
LSNLIEPHLYVGVVWPGDSRFIPVIDYPVEGAVAMRSGKLLSDFLNEGARSAASISFVSHSLGARMVLETARLLTPEISLDKIILMAGAIENNCLTKEYAAVSRRAQVIHVVASEKDMVLKLAFPIGNPPGEIIMSGHPYFRQALGLKGPSSFPANGVCKHCQIPEQWKYGHGNYLPSEENALPFSEPPGYPRNPPPFSPDDDQWKPAWSAAFVKGRST